MPEGRILSCDTNLVRIFYTNHRGERAVRLIRPICIHHACTAWHPDAQWLLKAFDIDKGQTGTLRCPASRGGREPVTTFKEPRRSTDG